MQLKVGEGGIFRCPEFFFFDNQAPTQKEIIKENSIIGTDNLNLKQITTKNRYKIHCQKFPRISLNNKRK